MNYPRFLGFTILACVAVLLFSGPATPASHAAKPHAPKKAAPKPKHQPKKQAKAPHHAKKGSPVKHNKKAAPKPKHHPNTHVKPNTHKEPKKKTAVNIAKNRHRERLTNRYHEWSRNSKHEHAWSRFHWNTHHFVHFDGEENNGFHFDKAWWNSYVANPGVMNWSDEAQGMPAQTQVAAAPPVVTIDRPLPLSRGGQDLAKLLDSMQVESHWLAYQEVDWRTGDPISSGVRGPANNGGAFVAAVCAKVKAPMPSSEAEDFLPRNQIDWLMNVGKMKGWVKVGEVESQVLANQGWVVIAAWQNMADAGKREISGQLAVVRPNLDPVSQLAERGPRVILAGAKNRNSIGLKDGLPGSAWNNQEVVYLAHRSR